MQASVVFLAFNLAKTLKIIVIYTQYFTSHMLLQNYLNNIWVLSMVCFQTKKGDSSGWLAHLLTAFAVDFVSNAAY